jgi:hypothetical protein
MEYWNTGILEYWNTGILEKGNINHYTKEQVITVCSIRAQV